jgi:hypothetical protein
MAGGVWRLTLRLLFTVIYARAFLRLNITTIDTGGGMRRSRLIEHKDHWSSLSFARPVGENGFLGINIMASPRKPAQLKAIDSNEQK